MINKGTIKESAEILVQIELFTIVIMAMNAINCVLLQAVLLCLQLTLLVVALML